MDLHQASALLPPLFPRARPGAFDGAPAACERFSIDTPKRFSTFIAQLGHESERFTRALERFNYSPERLQAVWPARFPTRAIAVALCAQGQQAIANRVYADRLGNGREAKGNGWLYRGRGWIQLTGLDNYRRAGAALGLDLLGHPEQASDPAVAWLIAGWFWTDNRLNELADTDQFEAMTRRINGGLAGYPDRVVLWGNVKKALQSLNAPAGAIA